MTNERLILVSGGSRGLGLAICASLLDEGYAVAAFSRSATTQAEALAAANPARFTFHHADMSSVSSLEELVRDVDERVGPIYGLVNNAGIAAEGVLPTFRESQVEDVISTNLTGTIQLTRLVLRRMIRRREGRIINISSIIGLRGYSGLSVYSATKAGMDGLTRSLARELGPRNITVNSIAPGYLETEMTHGLSAEQHGQIIRRTPMGRLGRPDDVVGAVQLLLSARSSFITGQVITIDGGLTC